MKLPTFSALAAASVLVVVPFTLGCAGEDAEAQEVQYPQTPVGYDTSTEYAQAQAQTSQSSPNPAEAQPIEGAEGGEVDIGAQPAPEQVAATDDSVEYEDTDPSAMTDFHTTLDPYGSWVDDGTYGTVWVPSAGVVGDGFTPYVSAGHWTYDDDYVWVSDYSWGWAPFHYGRWVYIGGTGWGWVPGRVYAGAWVSWRVGYDDWAYVGWAPMPPTWYWRGGYAYGLGRVPYASYTFCHSGDLFHPAVAHQVVTGHEVGVIAGHTQPYQAHPTVGGAGGHVAAHPGVGGPPPGLLHIAPSAVAHSPAGNPGLNQARAFSRPSTAGSLGGRPPAGQFGRPGAVGGVAGNGNFGRTGGPGAPSYHPGYTQGYHPGYSGGRSVGTGGYSGGYRPSYGGGYHPSYGGGGYHPSYGGGYHPSYGGGYSGGYHPSYGGGYAGGYHPYGSAPTFHAPSPSHPSSGRRSYSSGSAPVIHGGGWRGGGGFRGGGFSGGGFHGGGGGHHR